MKLIRLKNPCWANITYHAIEQFISRYEPEKTFEEAEDELVYLLYTSHEDGQSLCGDKVYVSKYRPEVRMVIKDHNVCVTVLPKNINNSNLDDIIQNELEERRQYDLRQNNIIQHQIDEIKKNINELQQTKIELGLKLNKAKNELAKLQQKLTI